MPPYGIDFTADVFAVGLEGGFPNAEALRRPAPDALARDLADAVEILLATSRD